MCSKTNSLLHHGSRLPHLALAPEALQLTTRAHGETAGLKFDRLTSLGTVSFIRADEVSMRISGEAHDPWRRKPPVGSELTQRWGRNPAPVLTRQSNQK